MFLYRLNIGAGQLSNYGLSISHTRVLAGESSKSKINISLQ